MTLVQSLTELIESQQPDFSAIRDALLRDPDKYVTDHKVRAFLNETYAKNPFVPCLPEPNNAVTVPFAEGLQLRGIEVTPKVIDLAGYREYLLSTWEFYVPRFGGSNVMHGNSYFFQKTIEHYLSWQIIREMQAKVILDIGSAGTQVARTFKSLKPDLSVYALDLIFPSGTTKVDENIYTLGSSAGSISLPDNSIDYVCLHCAIEHFEGAADIQAMKEIVRILRPGGIALIVPVHNAIQYKILVNPITGPYLTPGFMAEVVEPEIANGAKIEYTTMMVSRFARLYSADTILHRLITPNVQAGTIVNSIEFGNEFQSETILPETICDGAYSKFIPHNRRYSLQIKKLTSERI